MMNEDMFRMLELYRQGLNCGQILMSLGLEAQGKTNPDLVQAMAGLGGGIGFTGKTCGALTGGACLLSLYAGIGTPAAAANDLLLMDMVSELAQWFETEVGQTHGGINCAEILGDELENKTPTMKCANILGETYAKIKDILTENGIDPEKEPND